MRGQIKSFASTRNVFSMHNDTFKLIVLDEADAMTQAAQGALRRGTCYHPPSAFLTGSDGAVYA